MYELEQGGTLTRLLSSSGTPRHFEVNDFTKTRLLKETYTGCPGLKYPKDLNFVKSRLGGFEVANPLRKSKVASSIPAGVDIFSGYENRRYTCNMIMWQVKNPLSINLALVLLEKLNQDGGKKREEPGLGWRKGKSPALDGEGMRGEPWLERTGRERERKGLSPRLEWKDDERRWR
ncbi:hypothetical protein TNCV_1557551 [Trichonephila clavipes]|nr:hypothetical protein TNCV_1557551 [Trichonephila clavipes]